MRPSRPIDHPSTLPRRRLLASVAALAGSLGAGLLATLLALVAAVYRERRRQRSQLSIWRRLQVGGDTAQPR